LTRSTGHLARFIVFGSFVTAKSEPNDVDIFLLMEDSFDVRQVSSEARLVFDHAAAQNLLGASVFWIRRAAALGWRRSGDCSLANQAPRKQARHPGGHWS